MFGDGPFLTTSPRFIESLEALRSLPHPQFQRPVVVPGSMATISSMEHFHGTSVFKKPWCISSSSWHSECVLPAAI